jgi:hypothetical protein
MGLMTLFNQISQEKLTPNQFYLLYCINYKLAPPTINIQLEIRMLVNDGWVIMKDEEVLLEPKAVSFISKLESYFNIHNKKSNNSLMGDDFETNAEKYNNIFPRMKLGSNKPARASIKEIIPAFRWFFDEYEYTWETIFQATEAYLESERSKGFKYTRTSKYFIRKQENDKSWGSDLASYCDLVLNGEDFEKDDFKDKVF